MEKVNPTANGLPWLLAIVATSDPTKQGHRQGRRSLAATREAGEMFAILLLPKATPHPPFINAEKMRSRRLRQACKRRRSQGMGRQCIKRVLSRFDPAMETCLLIIFFGESTINPLEMLPHDWQLYHWFRLLQEARGLDAGPRLVQKLIGFGDHKTSNIVAMIAEEEVAHVAVGVFWFTQLCQKMGRTPCDTFIDLLKGYSVELKGPFNYAARDKAEMPRDWYDDDSLIQDAAKKRLSEVHDRLANIISMEQESSKLG